MMEADFELAQRLQAEEQGEITITERSRLFVKLMNKRKKHFAKLRVEKKRRKPPTKAQKRNLMSTFLKNMGGYKYNQLKSKSYDEIQKLFDNEMKRVNTLIPMDSEVMKSKEGTEESSKRTEDELESDKSKKAESSEKKAEGSRKKSIEVKEDDEAEMKKHMEVVQDDEEIAIDVIPLATKPLIIVEYKIVKEGQKGFYHLIRADGSSNRYSSMIRMLQNISREDLETLWNTAGTKVNAAGLQLLEELLLGGGSDLVCLEEDGSTSFLALSTSSSLSSWMMVVLAFGLRADRMSSHSVWIRHSHAHSERRVDDKVYHLLD
ncbi:hypothetical protein Tco_0724671 [Tanacetum coccineum]